MATVQFHTAVDMTAQQIFYGNVLQADASTIVISDGLNSAAYFGQFAYDADDNVYGTLQGVDVTIGGQPYYTAIDINFPANIFQSFIDSGNVNGALTQVLAGPDAFYGSAGNDVFYTFNGDDLIAAGDGDDYVFGVEGSDTVLGGFGSDTIDGGDGDDIILGGQGSGADVLYGGAGNDQMYASDGDDVLLGFEGSDIVGGGQGADFMSGGTENDVLFGGGGIGSDTIGGDAGNDRIFAGGGDDVVIGGDGDDEVGAGAGADAVFGGAGNDIIYLGANDGTADVYYAVENNGNDTIYGFEDVADFLDLRKLGFTSFTQVQAAVSSASDGDAVITVAAGQTITLDGISAAQIDATDFIF